MAEETSSGWIPDDQTFGARLALIRQHMGWGNVKEAALACDLSPESWRTWERDGVSPQRVWEKAQKIVSRTGVDYVWLLTGKRPALVTAGTTIPYDRSSSLPVLMPAGRPDPLRTPLAA